MAKYFALASEKHIKMDARNEQLEIYETRSAAEVAAWGLGVKVEEVEVVKKGSYESLQRERDALREALNEIANPIQYMSQAAEKEGGRINALAALGLSNDPNYLKDIAIKALSKGASQ